jgi:hypothetical protein
MASVLPIKKNHSVPREVNNRYPQYGLALPKTILRGLRERGIYCRPTLTLEYQARAKQYVLCATESGGAVADMGRYCAYLDVKGRPLHWVLPIDSLGNNGRHALIVAPELVRIEMLRIGRTYELILTHHALLAAEDKVRPGISSRVLFRGFQGTLALETWLPANKELRGQIAPVFYTAAGEVRELPTRFETAIRTLAGAVACIGCKHAHVAAAPRPPEEALLPQPLKA